MDFEKIIQLMEKFDASESVYLELEAEDVSLKLKKAEACKTSAATAGAVPVPFMPQPAMVPQQGIQEEKAPVKETAENPAKAGYGEADYVKAPLVGVFYAAPSPDKEPFVQVGSHVEKGDTICLIEAMKMMSEVSAPKSGTIREILVANGDMVEFDAPLFVIQE